MDGLTEGRIVHFVLPDGPYKGEHRPAIVVKVWRYKTVTNSVETLLAPENGCCQLQIFMDSDGVHNYNDGGRSLRWGSSIVNDELTKAPGTWHWIEKA